MHQVHAASDGAVESCMRAILKRASELNMYRFDDVYCVNTDTTGITGVLHVYHRYHWYHRFDSTAHIVRDRLFCSRLHHVCISDTLNGRYRRGPAFYTSFYSFFPLLFLNEKIMRHRFRHDVFHLSERSPQSNHLVTYQSRVRNTDNEFTINNATTTTNVRRAVSRQTWRKLYARHDQFIVSMHVTYKP